MKPWLVGIAAGGLCAATVLVLRAYESMDMQIAWERLLAFCGH